MTITEEHRAVVEALGLSAEDLRALAEALERTEVVVSVEELVQAHLSVLPAHHRYGKSLERLAHWAGDRPASSVSAGEIAEWARRAGDEGRQDPKSRHGIGAEEAFVLAARAAYGAGIVAGLVRVNPAADVPLPERPSSRRTALTFEELKQVHLAAVAHSRDPELDDLVFQFLRETACRRRGVLRLARRDLAPATRSVRLTEKYGKQRWMPVSAHLVDRLLSHADARHRGCDRVLHRLGEAHMTDKWFEGFARRMQALPWAAELGVSAHWIRHTTLTDIERIAGVRVAAAYAGHADGSFGVTGTYTKPSPEELRLAHQRLFFDDPRHVDDADMAPQLFRRAVAAPSSSLEFSQPGWM
jgi:integrase/recombinase XerC